MTKHQDLDIGVPNDDREVKGYLECVRQALFFPDIDMDVWIQREGLDNIRVARRAGKVVGGVIGQPMGQWFGGQSVPMSAVRAVGVAPEHRGTGVATRMMQGLMEELHREGVPISTLFPATQPVYRRAGYEQAGVQLTYRLPLQAIDSCDRALPLRRIEPKDHEAVRAAYSVRASRTAGCLDRNEWAWNRIFSPVLSAQNTYGYLVEQDGRVTGYVVYSQVQGERIAHAHKLVLSDSVVLTPEAGRRLLAFLADHESMVESITWYGAPADPVLYLLGDQSWRHVDRLDWMLRVVDVGRALEARGYPPGITGEVHFDVSDDVLAQNNRRFVLEVAESRGHVREGGQGTIRIDVRGLAAVYTGHLTPLELKTTTLVDAADDDLLAMARFFAGPSPWMSDRF